jgi:FtsZ-interacting cell division protein ZipA
MHDQQLTALAHTVTMLAGMAGAFTAIFTGLWAARRSEKARRAKRPTRREARRRRAVTASGA